MYRLVQTAQLSTIIVIEQDSWDEGEERGQRLNERVMQIEDGAQSCRVFLSIGTQPLDVLFLLNIIATFLGRSRKR